MLLSNETVPSVTMALDARFGLVWKEDRAIVGKRLTDRKIAQYERRGFYSTEYRKARKERMDMKRLKRELAEQRREGNFVVNEGRLIYSPL